MPTVNLNTFSQLKLEPAMYPESARMIAAAFQAGQTIARGTLLGELTASPGTYVPYAHGGADGSQVPKAIAAYDIVTDANGMITNLSGPSYPGYSRYAPVYYSGVFNCGDIYGTELQYALASPGFGSLIQGSATAGMFRMGV